MALIQAQQSLMKTSSSVTVQGKLIFPSPIIRMSDEWKPKGLGAAMATLSH